MFVFSNLVAQDRTLFEISKDDQVAVESFLSYLFVDEGFSYVLFGSKPMATTAYKKNITPTSQEMAQHPMFKLESWWKKWEKYNHLLCTNDYYFFCQDSEEWFEVFFLKKSRCLQVIADNLSLFRLKIEKNLSPSEILEHILSSDEIFTDGLQGSQALFGLLLGYGRKNSIGFEKYYSKEKRAYFLFPKASYEVAPVETSEFIVPCFTSFSNRETKKLLGSYNKQRKEILHLFAEGNCLEIVLLALNLL